MTFSKGRRATPMTYAPLAARELTEREASILSFLLEVDDPRLAPLRAQAQTASVPSRRRSAPSPRRCRLLGVHDVACPETGARLVTFTTRERP
jgi:hypothetical protein